MDIYKNHVSGILIIKKIKETTHRVVLTSDFGNKLIDFEVSENDFKLNYVLPDLDKKIVINFLKSDFQELLRQKYPVNESFENENSKIYLSKIEKKNYYLFFNKENNLLKQIIYTKNNKEKIDFTFDAKAMGVLSTMGSASMSARKPTTGPGLPPFKIPTITWR